MADVYEWPDKLSFKLVKEEGLGLTCMLCKSGRPTDMTATYGLGGERTTFGVHAECVKSIRVKA